ncbi:hypothetical protein QYM36_018900, partial [Artemia franciscana]
LQRREVIGSFIEVADDEISAYKAEIVNSKGRVDELKDRKNMENHPSTDARFIDKFDLVHLNRKPELCEKLKAMLIKCKTIFSVHAYDIGQNSLMEFKVDIDKSAPPPKPKSFNLPLKMQEVLQQHIYAMTKAGIIKPGRSEYCCPLFVIAKISEGKIPHKHEWTMENTRVIYDCREINKLVKDSAWPIRRIQDVLNQLSSKRNFSILDLKHAFFNVPLAEESQQYYSFSGPDGVQYVYRKLPQAADMAERSSVHGILTADRAEKSSVPEESAADMAERSSVHGILTADRAEKSSVPEELAADMAERSSVHGIFSR